MRTVTAIRYVTPLREGGSLPAVVEGDDGRLWVVKFRGAGQGVKALVAEVLAGTLAGALGLPVPELALVQVAAELGRTEPDPEIQDLLRASVGENVGLELLSGALMFDPAADPPPDAALASAIVVFDAYVTNVDRAARNPNLLRWRDRMWLIDHGASFVFLHQWDGTPARATTPFAPIRQHVLLPWADAIPEAGAALRARLDDAALARAVDEVPEAWLEPPASRAALLAYLVRRREQADPFLEEAERARARGV